jgi:predicted ribosomally synthesized peptide with SipW-like signal peptide
MATSHTRARRVKGLIAGACGAALLLAGGTWALWYDSDTVSGATITAGNLELEPAGGLGVYDISNFTGTRGGTYSGGFTGVSPGGSFRDDQDPDADDPNPAAVDLSEVYPCLPKSSDGLPVNLTYRTSFDGVLGHTIDSLDTWRAVPGDTVALVYPYAVALEGDNLVADLKLTTTGDTSYFRLAFDANMTMQAFQKLDTGVQQVFSFGAPETKQLLNQAVAGGAGYSQTVHLQAANEANGTLDPPQNDTTNFGRNNIYPVDKTAIARDADDKVPTSEANFCIVITGTFDPNTGDRRDADEYAPDHPSYDYYSPHGWAGKDLITWPGLQVTLTQTRQAGLGHF